MTQQANVNLSLCYYVIHIAISLYLTQQANERVRNPSYTALLNEMHLEGFEIEVITEDAISSAIQNVSG